MSHHTGHNLPTDNPEASSRSSKAQGGGSTPGDRRYVLSQAQLDSLITAAKQEERTRLLSLPSMAEEPEEDRPYSIQYRDSELTDLAQFARSSGRNQLRASLRAEVGQSDTERSKT